MSQSLQEKTFETLKLTREKGLGYLNTRTFGFNGKVIESEKGDMVIFGLCDYLKIMPDERIKAAAIEAIKNHGINFAVSRAFIKLALYDQAETYLSKVFERPVVLFSRAALMHQGVMGSLIEKGDAVIIDQQVHETLQNGAGLLLARGISVDIIRHNKMDRLRDKVKALKEKHRLIWYFADGIYSMYGDPVEVEGMKALLDEFEQLRLYVDDAHGLSWTGTNGTGYVMEHFGHHPQVILTSSLGKGFGAGGGIVVCPDQKTKDKILFAGSPLMFSSPIEPSMQGAIVASSKIHLSDEITRKQERIKELMEYFYQGVEQRGLPIISTHRTPIGYFPTGNNDAIIFFGEHLQNHGFIVTGGLHPAVGVNNTGVRVQISLYQTEQDIDSLLDTMVEGYQILEKTQGVTIDKILKFFKK